MSRQITYAQKIEDTLNLFEENAQNISKVHCLNM